MEEDILHQIERLLQGNPSNFSIIEEKIDIETQLAYFKCSKQVKEQKEDLPIGLLREQLQDPAIGEDAQHLLLCRLASSDEVEAYRAIEQFYATAQGEMRNWAAMALREGKMMMESSLLEEKQILISTGMGGKGTKLRYFLVLIAESENGFSSMQQKVIADEFAFHFQAQNSELETIEFDKQFAKIVTLIPLNKSVKDLMRKTVDECNQYGGFIKPNFLVTNVKELTTAEIEEFLAEADKPTLNDEDSSNVLPL